MSEMIVPDEAVKYILFQRTAYLRLPNTFAYRMLSKVLPFSIYKHVVTMEANSNRARIKALYEDDMRAEYFSIKDHLPETCSSVLDIGCGVAGIDIFVSRHYRDKQPVFYLLDKTQTESRIFYDYKPIGAFYNSLNMAKVMLVGNGIPENCVHLVEATDNNDISIDGKVDMVISITSWGFHYPVETYLEKAYDLLVDGGTMIIDVRKNTNGIDEISSIFGNASVIVDEEKFQRVLASK